MLIYFYGGTNKPLKRSHGHLQAGQASVRASNRLAVFVHIAEKVAQKAHADIIVLRSDEASIKISHIRQMQYEISLMPYEAEKKVYIVYQADSMQKPAQNSLLKLLEEPNEYAIIILLAQSKERILSNCLIEMSGV